MFELQINALDTIILIGASVPTLYMAYRVRLPPFRVLSVLLSAFVLVHGIYHLLDVIVGLGNDGIFELVNGSLIGPFDLILLLAFVIYYARRAG